MPTPDMDHPNGDEMPSPEVKQKVITVAPDRSLEEKFNQYGLTAKEWDAAVKIGCSLHDKLLSEPEGEHWYDGQSLSIMEHLSQAVNVRSALSPVQGEELPERPRFNTLSGASLHVAVAATQHFEVLEAEIGRLKGDLEESNASELLMAAKFDDAEDALGDAYVFTTGRVAQWSNLFGYDEATNEIAERVKGLQDALSTCRADALRECLEAVSTFSQTGIAEGDYGRGYRRATEEIRKAILALPKAGK